MYKVYDENDVLRYESYQETFIDFCKSNNFPLMPFRKSHINNERMFLNINNSYKTRITNLGYIKYQGWIVKRIKS